MNGESDDSRLLNRLKDRKIELISKKIRRKIKGIEKKELIDTKWESNINTAAKELVSSENFAS